VCTDESITKAIFKGGGIIRLTDLERAIRQEKEHMARPSFVKQAVATGIQSGIRCSSTSFIGVMTQESQFPKTTNWSECIIYSC
jgi:hypothetical protein